MGDSAYAQLTILSMPYDTDTVVEVWDLLLGWFDGDHSLDVDLATTVADMRNAMIDTAWDGDQSILIPQELGDDLERLGVTFHLHQDGFSEFDSETVTNVPPLGSYWSSGPDDGYERVVALIEKIRPQAEADGVSRETLDLVLAATRKEFGRDIIETFIWAASVAGKW